MAQVDSLKLKVRVLRVKVKLLRLIGDAVFNEQEHPRKPAGKGGGQFTAQGGGGGSTAKTTAIPTKQAPDRGSPYSIPSVIPVIDLPNDQWDKLNLLADKADERYEKQPIKNIISVPLDKLIAFQDSVDKKKLSRLIESFSNEHNSEKPLVLKVGEQYFLYDGNHRANAAKLKGLKNLKVNLIGDITEEFFGKKEKAPAKEKPASKFSWWRRRF